MQVRHPDTGRDKAAQAERYGNSGEWHKLSVEEHHPPNAGKLRPQASSMEINTNAALRHRTDSNKTERC